VVEQQVYEKLLASHIQEHLPSDEGKARAEFQQEVGDVLDQRGFDLPFLRLLAQTEEIEAIRVFEGFPGKIRLRLGQGEGEIRDRTAAALDLAGFDLHDEDVARPVVLDGFLRIPEAVFPGFELVE
jgi:hypothetical protein